MPIPYESNKPLDLPHDPDEDARQLSPPCVHKAGLAPVGGEFVLMKGITGYPAWYCTNIRQVHAGRIIVDRYTAIT